MERIARQLTRHPERRKRRPHRSDGSERGYVLALTAMIMIPLLAVAGMATDLGGWYAEGAKMQKAADAAALAGVVWLPDLSKATAVANDTARANGFDIDDSDIDIVVGQLNSTEIRVTITDTKGPLYFSQFFLDSMSITRESIGTYVLPVPLGSPRNYFGTGDMAPSPDGMWAAVNGWCAPKESGDPFAVAYEGNASTCPGSTVNGQYVTDPSSTYEYIINVPANRTASIVVHLFSPAKTNSAPDWNDSTTITTRFLMRSPDSTPFSDTDNPVTSCGGAGESNPRSYVPAEVDNDATIFSRSGWSRFCTIPMTAPAGQYILGVRTLQAETGSNSFNNYSIMASYNGAGVVCDSRTDPICPTVYGKNWISVYASATTSAADFYLAEVGAEHAGKQMEITLFDPGEGANYIQIKDPAGNPVSFSYRTSDNYYSGTGLTQLDVSRRGSSYPQVGPNRGSDYQFNERFVVLTVDLPANYATAYPGQKWWKIYYNVSSSVTDRSTWSVRIIGDPVHLSG